MEEIFPKISDFSDDVEHEQAIVADILKDIRPDHVVELLDDQVVSTVLDSEHLAMLGYGDSLNDPDSISIEVSQAVFGADYDSLEIQAGFAMDGEVSDDVNSSEIFLGSAGVKNGFQVLDADGLKRWTRSAPRATTPGSVRDGSRRFPSLMETLERRESYRKRMGISSESSEA